MPRGKHCLLTSYHHEVARILIPGNLFSFSIWGPTDELYPFTKSSETGLGYSTDSTAFPRGRRQVPIVGHESLNFHEQLSQLTSPSSILTIYQIWTLVSGKRQV